MKHRKLWCFVLSCLLLIALPAMLQAQDMENKKEKLAVLWISGDRDVAEKSCLMYTHAAKRNGWFDEVVFIVWGSSSRLLAEDEALQEKIKVHEGRRGDSGSVHCLQQHAGCNRGFEGIGHRCERHGSATHRLPEEWLSCSHLLICSPSHFAYHCQFVRLFPWRDIWTSSGNSME